MINQINEKAGPVELLEKIVTTNLVYDSAGNSYELSANVDKSEGEFIMRIVRSIKPSKSIEVGFANGIATLYICAALNEQRSKQHTVIDPNQSTEWHNVGLTNISLAGIDYCKLMEMPSEIALPNLLAEKRKFDFAFIDGWHTFDHALMDFFFIDKMLEINGVIIIDDIGMPSLNKMMRYILSNYSNYEVVDINRFVVPKSIRFKFRHILQSGLRNLISLIPRKISKRIFASKIIDADSSLFIDGSMIAIKKVRDDVRSWNYFKEF